MKSTVALISAIVLAITALGAAPVSVTLAHAQTAGPSASMPVFTQVTTGYSFDCGLTKKGTIVCWGNDSWGQADPPSGHFIQVSAGGRWAYGMFPFACAIESDGGIVCWGNKSSGVTEPPSGRYTQVSAALGASYACGIKVGGAVACWGGYASHNPVPGVKFVQLATAGDFQNVDGFGCGIRRNGRPMCWGDNDNGQGPPAPVPTPTTPLVQITVGYNGQPDNGGAPFACGITRAHQVLCWGDVLPGFAPKGRFVHVSATGNSVCGIQPGGKNVCWTQFWKSGTIPYLKTMTPPGIFTSVSNAACGLKRGGSISCWRATTGQIYNSLTDVMEVSAGPGDANGDYSTGVACGLQHSGSIVCWGVNTNTSLPTFWPGRFVQVAVGAGAGGESSAFVCGLINNGKIVCRGKVPSGRIPTGSFRQISANERASLACGLTVGGRIACWGEMVGKGGIPSSPPGHFVQVSAGVLNNSGTVVCGLSPSGKISCWPNSASFRPPSGTYTQVSGNGCALKKGGSMVCWGNDAGNHSGPFTQMSAGYNFACGLMQGGSVNCWGSGFGHSQFPSPKGAFTAVSAGLSLACGLRPDAGVECWGQDGVLNVKYPLGTPLGS